MLATALAPEVGYDKAAEISKEAFKIGQTIREVAREQTDLSEEELDEAPDAQDDSDLELARIGSLLFVFVDSPNDQIGSSSLIDTFATRLSAQPLKRKEKVFTRSYVVARLLCADFGVEALAMRRPKLARR
jgi:hypothetical protein